MTTKAVLVVGVGGVVPRKFWTFYMPNRAFWETFVR